MKTTRDQVIAHHVNMALRHCAAVTRESFADEAVDLYHQRTPLAQRGIQFHAVEKGGDPYAVQRANAQLLFRMLQGPVRLAAELEEAVVLALPQPYQGACLSDLAGRYGLLATPMPAENFAQSAARMGDLATDFGEAVQALAATLGDGHLTPGDRGDAALAVRELKELIATATSLLMQHESVLHLPEPGRASPVGGL